MKRVKDVLRPIAQENHIKLLTGQINAVEAEILGLYQVLTDYANVSYNSLVTERKFWTTIELSQASGVSDGYIRQILIAGKLKGEKVGRDWIIQADEANRYLQSRKESDRASQGADNT